VCCHTSRIECGGAVVERITIVGNRRHHVSSAVIQFAVEYVVERAAAAGGLTTIYCMPNTKPVNDQRAVTELIVRRAQDDHLRDDRTAVEAGVDEVNGHAAEGTNG